METGVAVTYRDGSRSVITRSATGEVRETEVVDGQDPYLYISENGVLETGYEDIAAGTSDVFSYTFATDDLLPLRTWWGREGEQIVTDADGVEINRLRFSVRTRGKTEVTIGDCGFTSIPVEAYYFEPGDPSMVEFAYLVELGIPILVGSALLATGFGSGEPHIPVAIRSVAESE